MWGAPISNPSRSVSQAFLHAGARDAFNGKPRTAPQHISVPFHLRFLCPSFYLLFFLLSQPLMVYFHRIPISLLLYYIAAAAALPATANSTTHELAEVRQSFMAIDPH